MTRAVATFNIGSSSVKFSLFALDDEGRLAACELRGAVRNPGDAASLDLSDIAKARELEVALAGASGSTQLIVALATWLTGQAQQAGRELAGIGHRIVHGGTLHSGPARVRGDVLEKLEAYCVFAPAHQPHNLGGVRAIASAFPSLMQTLSFDTAFHRTMPRVAELYALPRELSDQGVLRFGFHGLSYAQMSETMEDLLGARPKRLVGLHLGSGASACAILDGRSVATSMGLTALDGLPMATRCGDLDPGVVLHLIRDRGMDPQDVADLLYQRSGLLGMSGISSDTRVLVESDAPEAQEALAVYCYRIAREAGSLAVALQGIDAVAFSGGVGEHSAEVRAQIARHLRWLGVELDDEANRRNASLLSPQDAAIPVACIVADEERIIARDCAALLQRTR